MPTTSTPVWAAPHNGLVGDASATAGTSGINQLLGTHGIQAVYQGQAITSNVYNLVTTPHPNTPWQAPLNQYDIDQPFTMAGTSIGRVTIGILPVGQGADLLVSLCADDGSGAPGAVVCQTRTPANWIYQMAAVAGTANGTPNGPVTNLTGNPLAIAPFISSFRNVSVAITPYPVPAYTGIAAASSTAWYYPYLIQVGGVNNDTALANVFTTPYGSSGAYGAQIQQAPFPTLNDGSSMTCVVVDPLTGDPIVVNAGGGTAYEGPAVATAYTATLDTATGSLSTWTQQNALPYAVQNHGFCASPAGYIYMIGGRNSGGVLNSVSYASVSNAQIGTWNSAIPLPEPVQLSAVGITCGYLFVCGGENAAFAPQSQVWYAPVNDDGSLGNWIQGPTLPTTFGVLNANPFVNDFGILCAIGTNFSSMFLPVTAAGPGPEWLQYLSDLGEYPGFCDQGNGIVSMGAIVPTATPPRANYASFYLSPQISVPLPATGLTSGATYHVLIQQQGGDLSDYNIAVMADEPTNRGQSSPPGEYTWTLWPENASGGRPVGAAITVYNNTPPQTAMPGMPLHLWEDQGAKVTTLVTATTPDQRLLGVCEATKKAYALNANTGFESGLSPWTVSGGTYAQSSAGAYTGAYSCQVTPSGTAASVYLDSEQLACMPGQWASVVGWMWFTSSVTANVSLSVNWYGLTGTYLSTSSNTVSVPAATWTEFTNTFQAPADAYQFTINPTLGGTPASSQIFYVDTIHAHYTYIGPQTSTVTAVEWSGTGWPAQGEPTGATQLA